MATSNGHAPGGYGAPLAAHERVTKPRSVVGKTAYHIAGTDGRVVAIHGRIDYDDGSKRMWWERPGGAKGLGGLAAADLPPYGAHEWQPDRPTIHVEGEKARDALAPLAEPLGYNVVGHVTGAPGDPQRGRTAPHPEPAAFPVGRQRRARRDADGPHARHPARPAARRAGHPADAKQGRGASPDLARLIAAAVPWSSATTTADATLRRVRFMTAREFAQQTPADTEWVVEPYVPVGGITKIDGPPKKAGKTTLHHPHDRGRARRP